MSKHSKKGYAHIRARDTKTGNIFTAAVPKGGAVHRRALAGQRKLEKERRRAFREFKDQLRVAKKAIPADQRANVSWSEVESRTIQSEGPDPS